MTAKEIIRKIGLMEHPEGGFYKETCRSSQSIETVQNKIRNVSTAIFEVAEEKISLKNSLT